MKTYTINEKDLEGKKVLAVGYKAIKYNGKTLQGDYCYGEKDSDIVGSIHTVDGVIKECGWGLHFSKDPAYVFNFYEPLGYNRYFKVEAYEECKDSNDGFKSVAKTLKFVEEYDLIQFIDIIKSYDRSAVSDSSAVSGSYAVYESEAVKNCLFCYGIECSKHKIFNKLVDENRYNEVHKRLLSFNYYPKYDNFYDLKGDKEWWSIAFPELMTVDNATAWGKMPKEMDEYIRSLPEFDEEIYKKITENEV